MTRQIDTAEVDSFGELVDLLVTWRLGIRHFCGGECALWTWNVPPSTEKELCCSILCAIFVCVLDFFAAKTVAVVECRGLQVPLWHRRFHFGHQARLHFQHLVHQQPWQLDVPLVPPCAGAQRSSVIHTREQTLNAQVNLLMSYHLMAIKFEASACKMRKGGKGKNLAFAAAFAWPLRRVSGL